MRAINLLPADAYVAKPKLPYARIVLAGTAPVLASALVFLGYSLEHSKVTDKQIALGVVESQVVALSPSQALVSRASAVSAARAQRVTELSDALGKQVAWDVALEQISRVLPANVWLTNLQAYSPTPVGASSSPPTPFTIQGYTYSSVDVARTLARLTLLPALTDVTLGSTSLQQLGSKTVTSFSITASVNGAAS